MNVDAIISDSEVLGKLKGNSDLVCVVYSGTVKQHFVHLPLPSSNPFCFTDIANIANIDSVWNVP